MLAQDERGVGKVLRIQPGTQPRADGEVPLRYRVRDNNVRIVTNAYFFPEGQAKRYEVARFGELRVGENGEALLVRMLGRTCSRYKGGPGARSAARRRKAAPIAPWPAPGNPPGRPRRRGSRSPARQASCSAASGAFVSMAGAPFCLDSFRPLSASRISGTCMARQRQVQQPSQHALARRGTEQVGAAHHVRDALGGVVHHHRQLIGPQPVGAAQGDVAHRPRHVLLLRPQPAVLEAFHAVRHAQAPGARLAAWRQAVAAGAWIGRSPSAPGAVWPRSAESAISRRVQPQP